MQTLTVNMPQALRAQLQLYQNDQGIEQAEAAIVAALQDYFQSWSPDNAPAPLPEMYDAEDGPCELLPSFLEPSGSETSLEPSASQASDLGSADSASSRPEKTVHSTC